MADTQGQKGDVFEWTPEQVGKWLEQERFSHWKNAFQGFTGQNLLDLTPDTFFFVPIRDPKPTPPECVTFFAKLNALKSPPSSPPDYTTRGLPPIQAGPNCPDSSTTANHEKVKIQTFTFRPSEVKFEGKCHVWELAEERNGVLPYGNHDDLGRLIGHVVEDGIRAAGLSRVLRLQLDQSLPSLRPDGAIHRGDSIEDSVPVGQLEFKLPLGPKRDHFAKHCGQMYDYLKSEKENRHAISPIALLTYFEEWYVCKLPEEHSPHSPQRTVTPLQTPSTPSTPSTPAFTPTTSKQGSPGPTTPFQCYSMEKHEESEEGEEGEEGDEGEEEDERILMVSQCFRSTNEEFWPMLITVLKEMHRATFAQPPDASSPRFVREVTPKSGLKWVHLSCGLPKLKWDRFPNSNCQSFFLWEDLGHGASGRAFLASSKSYRVCVVKCFFSKDKRNAEDESQNWKDVYGDTYQVRKQNLLNRDCLLMQYFSFINPSRRLFYLPKVRECLENFFVAKKRKHNDVKWRNMGLDNKKNVVVYDLGSVEKCGDGGWVEEAIRELKSRIGGEEEVVDTEDSPSSSSSSSSSSKRRVQPHRQAKHEGGGK